MFGVGLGELAVIAVIAILVFGPDKLPEFARQAGRFVREARKFANGARDQIRDELGPEYADLELKDLDPREFVRKQINQYAAEDDEGSTPKPTPKSSGGPLRSTLRPPLRPGEIPPFDSEAT